MKNQDYKPFILKSVLLGFIAQSATRQSPYNAPEGLVEVLIEFKQRIKDYTFDNQDDFISADRSFLNNLLKKELLTIPQVEKWNERKNGNKSPFGFCSAYDKPNPDNDFIDLDALVMNITRDCIKHDQEFRDNCI
jgi:hypothetical protein